MWSSRTSQGPSPQYGTRPRTGVKGLLYSVLGRVHCSCQNRSVREVGKLPSFCAQYRRSYPRPDCTWGVPISSTKNR